MFRWTKAKVQDSFLSVADLYTNFIDTAITDCLSIVRDSSLYNAKHLAELVDKKLSNHYEMDDKGKKKVKLIYFLLVVKTNT